MDASEHHNRLANEFVQSVGRGTRRPSEIAVVLETVILASMRLMTMHGQQPRVSAAMTEAAVQRALERFTENPGRQLNLGDIP